MDEKKKIVVVGSGQDPGKLVEQLAREEAAKLEELGTGRKLLVVPDERLRQKSKPVEKIDDYVKELAQFLLDQLAQTKSWGMAACQYGEMVRLIVVSVRGLDRVFVNPEFVSKSAQTRIVSEACRSIPGKNFMVRRPKIVKIRGLGLDGKTHSLRGRDVLAQVLCHEMDHLDGVLLDETEKYTRAPLVSGRMHEGRHRIEI